jgi:hypothetical protein
VILVTRLVVLDAEEQLPDSGKAGAQIGAVELGLAQALIARCGTGSENRSMGRTARAAVGGQCYRAAMLILHRSLAVDHGFGFFRL